ncbi:MAG TPA: CBS domain-containing protein [Terriglobales bacterium]|nr:CBS domain-containing protein [Terriglobales bacterium]
MLRLAMNHTLALTELLGSKVYDAAGAACGRVREVALTPQEDRTRISTLIVKTHRGDCLLPFNAIKSINGGVRAVNKEDEWPRDGGMEGLFLLERDLLDQQVIDVNGRKVVRVNDVDLHEELSGDRVVLRVGSVEVGARGAIRRLLKGVVPHTALHAILQRIPPRAIPWEFVDLIETDPARRVRLKISHERLAKLHPADIADIIEELAPDEREAVFETLDEEVAAEALEEVEPKLQKAIVESLDSDRVADIVEEMDPDAAADLLKDLPEEHTEKILEEMEPEEREEVSGLLEFSENTAAGRMTTEYISLGEDATVEEAIDALRNFEGGVETVSTFFIVDAEGKLKAAVPLAKLVLAQGEEALIRLAQEPLITCRPETRENEVAELFDKYNLLTLPVVDDDQHLVGVITSDDVISLLRSKL